MEAPWELFIVVDIMALLSSITSVVISTVMFPTNINITKVFRPIFISFSLVSLLVTSLNICDDVIPDMHDVYGGSGYVRLAVFGTNTLLVILHQICLTYAEFLTIRSMTGKKSLEHGKGLLLMVWILGLSLFGLLIAFANMVLVAVCVSIVIVLVSFVSITSYYFCKVRIHRNNRLYVEHIRWKNIRRDPDIKEGGHTRVVSSNQPWDDIFIPRILLIAYYTAVLPFIFDLLAHLVEDKQFSVAVTSRSAFLLIHDLYFIFFSFVLVYLKCSSWFPALPRLR